MLPGLRTGRRKVVPLARVAARKIDVYLRVRCSAGSACQVKYLGFSKVKRSMPLKKRGPVRETKSTCQKTNGFLKIFLEMSKTISLLLICFWKCQKHNVFLKDFFCKCLKTQCFLMFFFEISKKQWFFNVLFHVHLPPHCAW